MENVIVVKHSQYCIWDRFWCASVEDAKTVFELLRQKYPKNTTKLSEAIQNMVEHDRSVGLQMLKDYLESNGIKIVRK
jgi:hypothetical protein